MGLHFFLGICVKKTNLFQNNPGVENSNKPSLVGGFNPFEKPARQIGSFPQGSG